jgi:AcrR family transcriptional regulator
MPATIGAVPSVVNETGSARAVEEVGRERVAELQHARIVAAMGELVRERGVGAVTVGDVVGRSGVSRRTYYELFRDREGCLLATFDHAAQRAAAVVLPAYEAAGATQGASWEEQVRAGLAALLGFLDDEPALGGLLVVDALAGEHRLLERRTRVLDALVDTVHRGARASERTRVGRASGRRGPGAAGGKLPSRIVAEGVVGAVLAVVHARLLAKSPAALTSLLNPLMGMIVLPYLGPAAAERELAHRVPRARRRVAKPVDPLREIDMRLTYRTVRVLLAIAEHPAASGRQVADAAGVADQGQMSKLLTRLAHLGLIHNSASGTGRGEPNAWVLTPRGQAVEHVIRAQTAG